MSENPALPRTRRARIVCISDTHNQTPSLPRGDVLIHAGDLTNQGSLAELRKTVAWLEKADFEAKIVVAGNHDITLDADFYKEHWSHFHNQDEQSSEACAELLQGSPSITYLQHEAAHIALPKLGVHFTAFGSPYSPAHGSWAFGYQPEQAEPIWGRARIPQDTDVVVTHTPPRGHRDDAVARRPPGCEALRRRLWHVRPALHVCGHMHEGRGAERVWWSDDAPGSEARVQYWEDPGSGLGSRKQSLLDLTGARRTAWVGTPRDRHAREVRSSEGSGSRQGQGDVYASGVQLRPPSGRDMARLKDADSGWRSLSAHTIRRQTKTATIRGLAERSAHDPGFAGLEEEDNVMGASPSGGHGFNAGRRSTCVVNAAIMASSWGGPKRLNKPIVVDIDLPVWDG